MPLGIGGLNLRDSLVEVPLSDLVNVINWRLDERGALVKRLGFDAYSTTQTSAPVTELAVYRKAGATVQLIAACNNGTVQRSPGDGTWTNIKTGLSGAVPAICQFNNFLYYSNAVDGLQRWDGASWTAIAACPIKPTALAVWRGRLWASGDPADPKKVVWSNAFDAGTWQATNNVLVPGPLDDAVVALCAAPNIGSGFDGSDSLLVFHRRSTHAIYDASDNVAGVVTGGSNRELDDGHGCVAARSIAYGDGRVYLLGADGVYSTDGHNQLRLESAKLGRWMLDSLAKTALASACGVVFEGSYLISVIPTGASVNALVFEFYLRLGRDQQAQVPIMCHDMPAGAWAVYPATGGDTLYFADSSSGDTRYVRRAFTGGTDLDGSATTKAVTAEARTGSSDFNWPRRKRVKLIRMIFRGVITVGVVADLFDGVGETQTFSAVDSGVDLWSKATDKWGVGQWGGGSGNRSEPISQAYTRDGRRFSFTITESSSGTSTTRRVLGQPGQAAGGAAIYDFSVRTTPLNRE